ncbi:mechanosensitive ion channel family protein [Candidatus Woesearchaeota archaeon]|nr:mechanosensitive ion channel family protein [Candidatus Woesearchaeota archaeon]
MEFQNLTLYSNIKKGIILKLLEYSPRILISLVLLAVGYFAIKISKKIFIKLVENEKVKIDRSLKNFMENAVGFVLWAILITIILANLGVNVSGLIAGLGIAGFVIGFALKDTLGNLASGIFILSHKPFEVGHWVNIGGVVGGVEKIGIAACTLASPDGTKITIPNSRIWGDTIQNYTGNPVRKLFNLEVGISYSDDIGKAIKIINSILKKDKRVLKEPKPQVVAKGFGDSSITIAVRPAVKKEDYWGLYFDLVKEIKETFDKKRITIPFPQRDVWIKDSKKKK